MKIVNVIYILIVFSFVYPFFVRYFDFPYVEAFYVNVGIIGIFFYSWLICPVLGQARAQTNKVISIYKIMFLAFFTVVFFSSFFNGNHPWVVMKAVVETYFPYIFLFLIITRIKLNKREEENIIKLCFFLIILQIPVVLMQYYFGGYSSADSISGTISSKEWGGTGINGVLGAFLFSICASRIAITKLTLRPMLLGLMAFVPSIFGGSRFGIILMIVVVIILIISLILVSDSWGGKGIGRSFVSILLTTIIFYGVFVYIVQKYGFSDYIDLDMLTSWQEILEYDSDKGSQRIVGYEVLGKFAFRDWIDVMFGLGIGATEGSKEFGTKPNKTFQSYFPVGAPDGVYFMLTIGAIGLILMIIIIFYGIIWVKKYLQIETCPFFMMTGYAFPSITFVCLASITYTQVWSSQVGLTYWVLTGVLANRYGALVEKRWRACKSNEYYNGNT